ncbi:hypothetical protein PMZ80_003930 [Knufia obscura]|uniref:Uncharacterized protein n=2 Tax=Knufia TaxID=430999 RepID=A0AAN8I345_9EURO|nr:hypothetical protein PMZ80_003930 [Knufia obscura]KAK5952337.1 hypothetical protein OHC33_006810 [Knufia fluminis]
MPRIPAPIMPTLPTWTAEPASADAEADDAADEAAPETEEAASEAEDRAEEAALVTPEAAELYALPAASVADETALVADARRSVTLYWDASDARDAEASVLVAAASVKDSTWESAEEYSEDRSLFVTMLESIELRS